jgi:hypothetical protein
LIFLSLKYNGYTNLKQKFKHNAVNIFFNFKKE